MHCLDCQCNRSGSSLVNGLELEDIVRSHYADNGWKGKRVRVESVSMLAELARLRRMADAYAHWCVAHIENTGRCEDCGGARANRKLHTASCDVAIHLGLEREAP